MKKILLASGSRHTIPPIDSSPGVARIIHALAKSEGDGLEKFVISKYDAALEIQDFDNSKYLHSLPNWKNRLYESLLKLIPYRIKKKIFGFTQADRIVYYRSFKKLVKQLQPDVIVTFMHIELFKILKKTFPNAKHIYFYRSTDLEGRLGSANITYLLKNCDGFLANTKLAVSEFQKFDITQNIPSGTVYNAVELPDDWGSSRKLIRNIQRTKFGLAQDDFVVGYAGRFSEEKSLLELLEVLLLMKNKGHTIHLCIAGAIENEKTPDMIYYERVIKFVSDHLKEQVHFCGWVSADKLNAFYASLDLGVLLSKYREGNSMFMLEGLTVGVPIIATHVGGNIEIIENGNYGYLIDKNSIVEGLEEQFSDLYLNREKIKKMSKNAIAYAKNEHTFEVMTKRFDGFIKDIL